MEELENQLDNFLPINEFIKHFNKILTPTQLQILGNTYSDCNSSSNSVDGVISVQDVLTIVGNTKDAFILYDWNEGHHYNNSYGGSNSCSNSCSNDYVASRWIHEKASKINDVLMANRFSSWFYTTNTINKLLTKHNTPLTNTSTTKGTTTTPYELITNAIDSARTIIVLVTKSLIKKVEDGATITEPCTIAMNYCCRKAKEKIIFVLIDEELRTNISYSNCWGSSYGSWYDIIATITNVTSSEVISDRLHIDLSFYDDFDEKIADLCSQLLLLVNKPMDTMLASLRWHEITSQLLPPNGNSSSSSNKRKWNHNYYYDHDIYSCNSVQNSDKTSCKSQTENLEIISNWMIKNTTIILKDVERYAKLLQQNNIDTVTDLVTVVHKNPDYLVTIGIDEDNAEEIVSMILNNLSQNVVINSEPMNLLKSICNRLEVATTMTRVLQLLRTIDIINELEPLRQNQKDAVCKVLLDILPQFCTNRENLEEFGAFEGIFDDLVKYISTYQNIMETAEKGLTVMKCLCRYGVDYTTQVDTNTKLLSDLGACELCTQLLQRYYLDSKKVCYMGLLLVNSLALDNEKMFLTTDICSVIYSITENRVTLDTECCSYIAFGVSVAMNNLTRLSEEGIIEQLNAINMKSLLYERILMNKYMKNSDTILWTDIVVLKLSSNLSKTTIDDFVRLLDSENPLSVDLYQHTLRLAASCTNEAASELVGTTLDIIYYLKFLLSSSNINVLEATFMLFKHLLRYDVGPKSVLVDNVDTFLKAGLVHIITNLWLSLYQNNRIIAEYGCLIINAIAGDNHEYFLTHLEVVPVLFEVLKLYGNTDYSCNNKVCLAASFSINNLTRHKNATLLESINSVKGRSLVQYHLLDNAFITEEKTKYWAKRIVLNLK